MGDHHEDEKKIIGSPSSIFVKIKLPKLEAAPMEDKEGEKSLDDKKRVCPECKREFSSGKALGGHMRIHVQTPQIKPLKTTKFIRDDDHDTDYDRKKKKSEKPYYASCVNEQGKPTCSLCGKTFPSMKSLFGHMRCHPERLWRGILPPTNLIASSASASASTSSSLSQNVYINEEGNNDHQVVDLTKFLRGWSVTERRGRQALKKAAAAESDDDDEVLLGAVEDLMSLSRAAADYPSTAEESDVTQPQLQLGPGPLERSNSNSKNFSDNESDSRNKINTNNNNLLTTPPSTTKIKKRKKMKLMMELGMGMGMELGMGMEMEDLKTPPPPLVQLPMALRIFEEQQHGSSYKYKCNTCSKSFPTHQALGGHRSSHSNKIKNGDEFESSLLCGENMEKEVEFAADAMVALGSNNNGSTNGVHQCKICDKVFPTGQALGGHKRCHWSGFTDAAQAPSSQITSTGEGGGSQTQTAGGGGGRKGLDIDLNELPPTMMEDEAGNGDGNGNGYASSSYNSYMG